MPDSTILLFHLNRQDKTSRWLSIIKGTLSQDTSYSRKIKESWNLWKITYKFWNAAMLLAILMCFLLDLFWESQRSELTSSFLQDLFWESQSSELTFTFPPDLFCESQRSKLAFKIYFEKVKALSWRPPPPSSSPAAFKATPAFASAAGWLWHRIDGEQWQRKCTWVFL